MTERKMYVMVSLCLILCLVVTGLMFLLASMHWKLLAMKQCDHLLMIDEDNWQTTLKNEWILGFYSPACATCKTFVSTMRLIAPVAAALDIKVGIIDASNSPALSGRFYISTLPTIFHLNNGEIRQYSGEVSEKCLLKWLDKQQWMLMQPKPMWCKPDGMTMSVLAYFSKLSSELKMVNCKLQETLGLPYFLSYAVLVFATLAFGTLISYIMGYSFDVLVHHTKRYKQIAVKKQITITTTDVKPERYDDCESLNNDDKEGKEGKSDDEDDNMPTKEELLRQRMAQRTMKKALIRMLCKQAVRAKLNAT